MSYLRIRPCICIILFVPIHASIYGPSAYRAGPTRPKFLLVLDQLDLPPMPLPGS